MSFESFVLPAAILVGLTSLALLLLADWRMSILVLALQYAGVFVLVGVYMPFEMAAAKLVAGWIAGTVLGMGIASLPRKTEEETDFAETSQPEPRHPPSGMKVTGLSGLLFQLLAATLVALTAFSLAPKLISWIPGIQVETAWASLALISMGLLQLGFNDQPYRTILGLLTALAGFEVLYAVVESSALVTGMLATVTLGLSLIGAYLIMAPQMEEAE